MTVAMQINLFFVGAELFTDFYNETSHAASMHYLFLGLDGFAGLRRGSGSPLPSTWWR